MTINKLGDAIGNFIPTNELVTIFGINNEAMHFEEKWEGCACNIPYEYRQCKKWYISNFYRPFDLNLEYAYRINIVVEEGSEQNDN